MGNFSEEKVERREVRAQSDFGDRDRVGHQHLDLSDVGFTAALQSAPIRRKTATVQAYQATEPMRLRTVLASGAVETENNVGVGDYVVTNPGGEQYRMGREKFESRYAETEADGTYQATGRIRAIKNPTGGPISITAPWGEPMHGDEDCWIAAVEDENGISATDRYLIGADEMDDTYEVAAPPSKHVRFSQYRQRAEKKMALAEAEMAQAQKALDQARSQRPGLQRFRDARDAKRRLREATWDRDANEGAAHRFLMTEIRN